jgi:tetratricopeptide (TPR) repeat protein
MDREFGEVSEYNSVLPRALHLLIITIPLLIASNSSAQETLGAWESAIYQATTAAHDEKYAEAERFMAAALKAAEHFGPSDARLGTTYNTSGLIFKMEGKAKESETEFRRALPVFEKVYGADSLDAANICYNLSDALRQQGKFEPADPLLRRVLGAYEKILGKDSPKVAEVYFLLGDTQRHLRNYAAAEANLKHAADLREASGGMESTGLADALNSLALCYTAESNFSKAEPLFKLSLNIREAKYGLNHKDVVESLDNYAAMLREAGREKDGDKLTALANVVRAKLKPAKQ